MDSPIVIIIVLVVFFGIVAIIVRSWLKNTAQTRADALRSRFPNASHIAAGANFFGQKQKPGIRGNGTLLLANDALIFELWLPKREYRIPYHAITSIETVNSHMGKTVVQPLLKVNFTDENGTPDAMAWWLPNLDATKSALEAALRR